MISLYLNSFADVRGVSGSHTSQIGISRVAEQGFERLVKQRLLRVDSGLSRDSGTEQSFTLGTCEGFL